MLLKILKITFIGLIHMPWLCAQTPCIDGVADGYPCSNVDLLARLSLDDLQADIVNGVSANDIWGWTDPDTGKEYALIGMFNGTSFIDVSDPVNPIVIGRLPGHFEASGNPENRSSSAIWRDVKTNGNYAYTVSEDGEHGIQIFDLRQLRHVTNPPVTFEETAHYDGINDAHNIVINEETGFAYAVGATGGTSCNSGGLYMMDISNPIRPRHVGCYDLAGYTHDAQCVVYKGPDTKYLGKEVCINSNRNRLVFVDVSDKSNPKNIISAFYDGFGYTHQGWLTEDHKFFFANDEKDELNWGHTTKTYLWDVRDFDHPELMGTFEGKLNSVDHNLYVKDRLIYQSNYSSGLRILDARKIEENQIEELAYFDTYTIDNEASYNGSWSNYPFFESGTIIVSDRQNGLFILKHTLDLEEEEAEITGIDGEMFEITPFSITPNPVSDFLSITPNQAMVNITSVLIRDLQGRLIKTLDLEGSSIKGKESFDVSFMDEGLYYLQVSAGQSLYQQKFIVR